MERKRIVSLITDYFIKKIINQIRNKTIRVMIFTIVHKYFLNAAYDTNAKKNSERINRFINYVDVNVTYRNAKETNISSRKMKMLMVSSILRNFLLAY